MTRLLAILSCLAFVAPMLFFLARALPDAAARCRSSRPLAAAAALALALAAAFLFLRPQDDSFAGLDCSATRDLAEAFAAGRPIVGPDPVLAAVPAPLQKAFWYRTAKPSRPTRDLAFQLKRGETSQTVPFFTPFLSLAAAGSGMPPVFPAIPAFLWFATLLATAIGKAGFRGWALALSLILCTPWICWFSRGFYAEGAGAFLATAAFVSAMARPYRHAAAFAVAGFALGFAASVHPTLLVLSAPLALALLPGATSRAHPTALVAGGITGVLPAWAMTRYVCQPYGDWTRRESLARLFGATPEHRALATAALALAALGLAALAMATTRRGRAFCARCDARLQPWGWLAIALLPLLLFFAACRFSLPPLPPRAAASVFTTLAGIRLPGLLLGALATAATLRSGAPPGRRIAFCGLCWATVLFLFVKAAETPAGVWSQRRLLPVAIAFAALSVPSLSEVFERLRSGSGVAACALAAALGLANPVRWPAAYFAVNEEGARAWCEDFRRTLRGMGRPLTVFDYHAHSVPHAATLELPVLGLGEHQRDRWPDVAEWLASVASTGNVCVVTSYAPATLEEGFALEPAASRSGRFPTVATRGYLPVFPGERVVENTLLRVIPLADAAKNGAPLFQEKQLDNGPIGLRGPWGASRKGGRWTREGSGVIGPVPADGRVALSLDAEWFPPSDDPGWAVQTVTVLPPWGGEGATFHVAGGRTNLVAELLAPGGAPHPAGVYRFFSPRPYDPARFGEPGWPSDMGIFLRSVRIECR
ncbi:MAG: hypothetical protein ACOX5G_11955 [Kiritimatiellia bacterium]|jgi:hypothetical protein